MIRTGLVLAGAFALSACGNGANPVTGGDVEEPGAGTGGLAGTATFTGEVNAVTYDPDTDTLTINNLPFDGSDSGAESDSYVNTGVTAIDGFGVYESVQTAESGQRQYYAVFRESDSGELSALAVGTGDYQSFGFGGSALSRSRDSINMPTSGEAIYTGEYGGLRILNAGLGENDVQLVSGNAVMDIDFGDFDVTGAVEGRIVNRTYFDRNGNRIGTLPTVILATAEIGEDGTLNESTAGTLDSEGDALQTGTWSGLFGGANGEELAGVLTITGPEVEDSDFDVQETGVFTAAD